KTDAGKERRRHRWAEDVELRPDGSFRIDDVLPGTYFLGLRILISENGFGEDLVDCGTTFTVPPLPAGVGRLDEPLDIGVVPAKLKPRVVPGQVVPDFTVTSLAGAQVKLSDFRGKYVLLKWWLEWNDVDAEAPAL